jgi:uncharacterized RDD family membrane protein YckC
MNWHYLENNVQKGPISNEELEALFRAGKVDYNTLVWRDGMADWQPYGQAKAPVGGASPAAPGTAALGTAAAGGVVCAECGRSFPPDQVIRQGNLFICGGCKPAFLQKLKEGIAISGTMNYAGFWIRFAAKFIDGIIVGLVTMPLSFAINGLPGSRPPGEAIFRSLMITPITVALTCAYYTFFVGKFGATPGKMATSLVVVNPDGSKVSYAKALGRYFAAEFISGCFTLCIGYFMIGWDPEKRGLHDRICSTRVIRK